LTERKNKVRKVTTIAHPEKAIIAGRLNEQVLKK